MSSILSAANVIVGILGAVTATDPVGGAKSALTGASSLSELYKRLTAKTPALGDRIAQDLDAAMASQHLAPAQRLLIPQMIVVAPLTPTEVMAAARNPARICDAMLAKLTDPAHRAPATQDAFRRVVAPILTSLLADTAVADTLRPAFETAVAESLAYIADQVERMATLLHETAYRLGVQETLVRELARRYAPGSDGDFRSACLGLENALQIAAERAAAALLPHNTADQVDDVLAAVAALNAEGKLDDGSDALAAALAAQRELVAEHTSGLMRLLDSKVAQATLQNRPEEAAEALVEGLMLDAPDDPFEAIRALQDEWFVRGRDMGLAFDLQVSIALAQASQTHARTTDQRGAALNDLGNALSSLGEGDAGTARLEEAVRAYRAALEESTRDRAPLDWALTQNNLGNSLRTLGERDASTARLKEAVEAHRSALEEQTRDRVPMGWANCKNNLGNALQELGRRETGFSTLEQSILEYEEALKEWTRDRNPLNWSTVKNNIGNALQALGSRQVWDTNLEKAVQAYLDALKERTRDRVPLQWASTQMNLGNVLRTLGQRVVSNTQLEQAIEAYKEALKEWTRDRVPFKWAMIQGNLANVEIAYFDKTANPEHLANARVYIMAAREVFVEAKATQYLAMSDRQLATITAREA